MTSEFRSGFVCLIGRPNTGKSTLTNALVGAKIAITSSRPQTTRHTIRGILHREDGQVILVDTPGLHRPRTLLGQRLNDLVRDTYSEVDAVGVCIPADEKIGPGDKWILEQLKLVAPKTPVFGVVTKIDKVSKDAVAHQLMALSKVLGPEAEVIPVSAVSGDNVDRLAGLMRSLMPEGPALYPDGELTDEPETVLMAELIREAALEGVRDELPHSLAVVIEELKESKNSYGVPVLTIFANLYVERPSQKSIVIGRGGARLRQVGIEARHQLERIFGTKVFLDMHVKVAKDWQRDPKQLGKLGF
ncbi:GTPase Era [Hoyosella rhizosphaerae]|uniref:GTPase Era n=1 Tax=Hoyosella rhizosphaerae TaxID=1755582 RepID=A0A916XH87_9ACTN|nr:GTPase Era [Hoyosella rhizosphaerae]MBN4928036.1 GTPase Era [Hoyosella rhizosphaerae]GGC71892.1 GTPase Era [Hoyosella rhizosphaerae]